MKQILAPHLCHFFIFPSQVNGRRVALPHSPSPLISLSLAGQYITLQTTFGLQVRWDGNHYAQITVPRLVKGSFFKYSNQVAKPT